MLNLHEGGFYLIDKTPIRSRQAQAEQPSLPAPNRQKRAAMAYVRSFRRMTPAAAKTLNIAFDALASHDITYVNVIQTDKPSGL